jgi:hypothetical protein
LAVKRVVVCGTTRLEGKEGKKPGGVQIQTTPRLGHS